MINGTREVLALGALASLSLSIACDEDVKPQLAPQARSQAVQATGPAATATASPVVTAAATVEKPHKVLCDGQLGRAGKDAPKAPLARAGKTALLGEKLPVGSGHWTWVNLWAAWCVPCREEIPRLKSWEAKTAGERAPLRVAFISIDDDQRQLETFLAAQPAAGMSATYWLEDGPARVNWLKQAGFDGSDPELPAHLLVDPAGKVRCKQQGAIDDSDYAELVKILNGERTQ
ncbi:MAG TPA: TlpA disulfide reductase family protein [Polyangiaceae bacterium]|jgi:thiol-disulfide isomerase/thioredoxin|nr:TlpA disulfide reductase family protein [Polyangiaceae bacterium]